MRLAMMLRGDADMVASKSLKGSVAVLLVPNQCPSGKILSDEFLEVALPRGERNFSFDLRIELKFDCNDEISWKGDVLFNRRNCFTRAPHFSSPK